MGEKDLSFIGFWLSKGPLSENERKQKKKKKKNRLWNGPQISVKKIDERNERSDKELWRFRPQHWSIQQEPWRPKETYSQSSVETTTYNWWEENAKIWSYYQILHAESRNSPRKWDAEDSLGFWDTNLSASHDQTTRPWVKLQEKQTCVLQ